MAWLPTAETAVVTPADLAAFPTVRSGRVSL